MSPDTSQQHVSPGGGGLREAADKERAILRRTGLPTSHTLGITSTNHSSLRSVAGEVHPVAGIVGIGHCFRCN